MCIVLIVQFVCFISRAPVSASLLSLAVLISVMYGLFCGTRFPYSVTVEQINKK